jgi:SAM-dependent methyltransferase
MAFGDRRVNVARLNNGWMSDFDEIFELIKYDRNSTDALQDSISEISAILHRNSDEAAQLVKRMLDNYHYGLTVLPGDMPHEIFMLICDVTQPFRIPFMVERMKPLIDRLEDVHKKDVLDYGGGGGKDTILFARLASSVTYADLPDLVTTYISKRFEIRSLRNVEIKDARRLDPERRYDIVNCMDVVEHVYDVEYILADLIARVKEGGHLLCWPCFENQWDGDHIEKNCGYLPYFTDMLLEVGLEPVAPVRKDSFAVKRGLKPAELQLYHLRRARPICGSIAKERETIRRELYRLSLRYSGRTMRWCSAAFPFAWIFRKPVAACIADNLFDNYAIRRLSLNRLQTLSESAGGDALN